MPENSPRLGIPRPLGNENVNRANYRAALDAIDENAAKELDLAAHLADYMLQVPYGGTTTNNGNNYSITSPFISSLVAGMAVCVKINADSTGATTLDWYSTGAKAIKKSNGNSVTNLKANGIYTLRYDGTNFIVQGEGASGDATASDLLSGKKASVDAGDITGTMPDNVGDVNAVSYHVSGTSLHVVPAHGHVDGVDDAVVITDADFVTGNIKAGISLFDIIGKTEVVDTTEATNPITVADVLTPHVGFVNGAKVTGTMADRGTVSTDITTKAQQVTILAGKHSGSGTVQISATEQAKVIAGNIKAGITILGQAGSANVVDTTSGDAVAGDILAAKKAWVDGAEVTGSMVDRGTVNITPSTGNQAITAGKHSGSGVVYGDAELVAENIRLGINIFGVVGNVNADDTIKFGEAVDGDFNSTGNTVWSVASDDSAYVSKQFRNFTLNTGHTLTIDKRNKGMIIRCTGNVIINGSIDQNNKAARIALNAGGAAWGTVANISFVSPTLPLTMVTRLALTAGAGGKGGNGGATNSTGGNGMAGGLGGAFGGSGGGGGGAGGAGTSTGQGGGGGGAGNGGAGGLGDTDSMKNGIVGGVGAGTGGAAGGGGTLGSGLGTAGGLGGGGLIIIMCKGTLTISATGTIKASSTGVGGNGGAGAGTLGTGGGGGAGAGGGGVYIGKRGTYSNLGAITVNGGGGGSGGGGSGCGGNSGASGVIGSIITEQV